MLGVMIQGGLGNQLFQFAFGIERVKNKDNLRFIYDGEGLDSELASILRSRGFKIDVSKMPTLIRRSCNRLMRQYANESHDRKHWQAIKFLIERELRRKRIAETLILGQGLGYFEVPENEDLRDELAAGYFQSYRWVDRCRNEIVNSIIPYDEQSGIRDESRLPGKIVVHVRRGDYDQEGFGFLGPTYYQNGLRILQRRMEAQQILLFSDDVFYAKKMISGITDLPIEIVEDPKDSAMTTLRKMTGASGYVIANSSLSWWAAYLSEVPDGMVVAPDKWFKGFKDPQDLIPHNWIRINSNFL